MLFGVIKFYLFYTSKYMWCLLCLLVLFVFVVFVGAVVDVAMYDCVFVFFCFAMLLLVWFGRHVLNVFF